MHFDKFGYAVNVGDKGWEACKDRDILYEGDCTWVPRANFDTVLWAMVYRK